jgi:hypothetical protein
VAEWLRAMAEAPASESDDRQAAALPAPQPDQQRPLDAV